MGTKPKSKDCISNADKQKREYDQARRAAISQKDTKNAAEALANHPDSLFGARASVEIPSVTQDEIPSVAQDEIPSAAEWEGEWEAIEHPAEPALTETQSACSMM